MNNINFTLTIRCTTQEKAERLVELGEIKFNTPQSWVDYEEKYGKGRGDVLEGTFAFCHYSDLDQITTFASHYNLPNEDVFTFCKDGRIYYKRRSTMCLPCFCVYILKTDAFIIPEHKTGWQDVSTTISAKYFRDFLDHRPPAVIEKLPEAEKPAIVVINGFDIFKERIISKLESIGIERGEVLVEPINYYDFEQNGPFGWSEFNQYPPLELAIKSAAFANQSELRFIINSKNDIAVDYLLKNTIQIGSIADIAQKVPGYFFDGILVNARGYVEEMERPNRSYE